MIQTEARVTDVGEDGHFVRIALSVPEIARALSPGRFVLADLGDYLRTSLFPADIDPDGFEVLVPPDHPATALQPGIGVDLIGPLGRGFEVPAEAHRLLLVADTFHLPALLPLVLSDVEGLALQTSGVSPTLEVSQALLLSALTAADLYPVQRLPSALEVHIVTADGSIGHGGFALDLFPDLVRWADCVCIAADVAAYAALAETVREVRVNPASRFAQALVAPPDAFRCADAFPCANAFLCAMACGVGACQGCAVQVAGGIKLACTDGPVFDLLELR